jgi:hypothetical protein
MEAFRYNPEIVNETELAPLATAPSQMVAEMWRDLLEDHGIAALIRPGDAFYLFGAAGQACQVLVPAPQLAEARELLAAFDADAAEADPGAENA